MTGREILSYNIRKQMRLMKISPKKLSEDIGLSYTTVLEWTKGIKTPRVDNIELLADYFNVSITDLFHDPDDSDHVSKEEWELLDHYRKMDPVTKSALQTIIDGWLAGLSLSEYKNRVAFLEKHVEILKERLECSEKEQNLYAGYRSGYRNNVAAETHGVYGVRKEKES